MSRNKNSKFKEQAPLLLFSCCLCAGLVIAAYAQEQGWHNAELEGASIEQRQEACELNTSLNEESTLACMRAQHNLPAKFIGARP